MVQSVVTLAYPWACICGINTEGSCLPLFVRKGTPLIVEQLPDDEPEWRSSEDEDNCEPAPVRSRAFVVLG